MVVAMTIRLYRLDANSEFASAPSNARVIINYLFLTRNMEFIVLQISQVFCYSLTDICTRYRMPIVVIVEFVPILL